MKKTPNIEEIKKWLLENNPLNLFKDDNFVVKNIDPKVWSGHFDYLIEVCDKKIILRFKGPEWGEPAGIVDEYNILKKLEKYNVGPKAYYLTEDFFGEPMAFYEYLEGEMAGNMFDEKIEELSPEIAKFIAKINKIPFEMYEFPFQRDMMSYSKNKDAWKTRIEFVLGCDKFSDKIKEILTDIPKVESRLDEYEERLKRVMKKNGSAFIFESSHLGHLIKTTDGFRFFNWEQVSYGDPSFTLAVFLISLKNKENFEEIKEKMIKSYLEENPISEFRELLEQRIVEREMSNKIYLVWSEIKKTLHLS